MLKEKRQVLIDLYTPTFTPNCFLHNQKIKRKNKGSPNTIEEEEDEDDSDDSYVKEDNFNYKQDPNFYTEDDLQNELRKALLDKVKK